NADGHPDIRRDQYVGAAKSISGDADHGVRLAVDLKRAADKIVPPAHSFPKTVAGDYHCDVRVRFTFFRGIKPAAIRFRSHHRKIVFRGEEGEAAPHLVVASDAGDGKLERGKISENVAAILTQLALFVIGELAIIVTRVLARREHIHHFVRSQRYHRMQDHAVD